MSFKKIKYPLDTTGTSPENFVEGEPHLVPRDKSRAFATAYGPYYTDSLVVRVVGRTDPLEIDKDYKPIEHYQDATVELGQSVSCGVLITNRSIGSDIVIDYQVVGGPFSLSSDAIQHNLDVIEADNNKVKWSDVTGKPVRFPPAPHRHDAEDLYGMEYVVDAIDQLRLAILQGDVASHELIYDYIDRLKDLLYIDLDKMHERLDAAEKGLDDLLKRIDEIVLVLLPELEGKLTAHLNDFGNPHHVTKGQVGLSEVANYPPSTNNQALDENNNSSYITPSTMWYTLKQKVLSVIDAHIKDKNNPHETTKAQVGLGSVENYPMASQAEAIAHVLSNRYMSPVTTYDLVNSELTPVRTKLDTLRVDFDNHAGNKANPHQVTKAQVGLGLVENYATATNAELALNSNITNKYTTPNNVGYMLNLLKVEVDKNIKVVSDKLTSHIQDSGNPHNTTKAQVGLGSVANYAPASDQQARDGTASNVYCTPKDMRLYHLSMQTVSTSKPGSAAGYREGHLWYQVK